MIDCDTCVHPSHSAVCGTCVDYSNHVLCHSTMRKSSASASASAPTSLEDTLAERGKRYGTFFEHARVTQNIKAAMVDSNKWFDLSATQREALEMISHKIGRILNGDPNYFDSWHDIAGYSKLIADELQGIIK
jgi:hypothetical protein